MKRSGIREHRALILPDSTTFHPGYSLSILMSVVEPELHDFQRILCNAIDHAMFVGDPP